MRKYYNIGIYNYYYNDGGTYETAAWFISLCIRFVYRIFEYIIYISLKYINLYYKNRIYNKYNKNQSHRNSNINARIFE